MSGNVLIDFQIQRPKYETSQLEGLKWLAMAHAQAESLRQPQDSRLDEQKDDSYRFFLDQFLKIGCKPEHIAKRGHELPDFLHHDWAKMDIFRLGQSLTGAGLNQRQIFHDHATDAVFEKFYPDQSPSPDHLIHVSCTGYSSPSSAQKIVTARNWGDQTQVMHAYHMGCYASIPAIRMGVALVHQEGGRVDIVHTELCTLHFNASNHNADQIVLQSLFADGYIKYSVVPQEIARRTGRSHLKIIGMHEQLLPESAQAMTWSINDWGFKGTLSKKIPLLIAKNIRNYIALIAKKCNMTMEEILQKSLFAIHPGGPKILDLLGEALKLSDEQLRYSRLILKNYGNISSGTLPHIWEAMMADDEVREGTLVMSLAFGPGLNIAGLLAKKLKRSY